MSFFFCGAASVSMQHSQAQGGNLRGEDEEQAVQSWWNITWGYGGLGVTVLLCFHAWALVQCLTFSGKKQHLFMIGIRVEMNFTLMTSFWTV